MSTEDLTVTPSSFEFGQILNDESFRDANGGVWTTGRNGNRWQLTLTYNNLTGSGRRALWAHVAQLRGQQNRLEVTLTTNLNYARKGAGGSTPMMVGAHSAAAESLSFDNASDEAEYLAAGDFLKVNNELKIVTGAVTTSGGTGTVSIWPELHQDYADNQVINIYNPAGVFFLIEAQGLSVTPHPADDAGAPWLSPVVTLLLEEDVSA